MSNTAVAQIEQEQAKINPYTLTPKEVFQQTTALLVELTGRDSRECYEALCRSASDPRYKKYTHSTIWQNGKEIYTFDGFRDVLKDQKCKSDYYFGCACEAQPLQHCPHRGAYMTFQVYYDKTTGKMTWVEPRAAICKKYQTAKQEMLARKYGKPTETKDDLNAEVNEFFK